MTEQEKIPELLDFFRALADENRLKDCRFPGAKTLVSHRPGAGVGVECFHHLQPPLQPGVRRTGEGAAGGTLLYLLAANGDDKDHGQALASGGEPAQVI